MADEPSPRRCFQFRLRTLFVVVTLIALACGWAVDRARLTHERDDAIRRADTIEQLARQFLKGGFTENDTGVLEFRPNTTPEVIEEARRLLPKMMIKVRPEK